MIISCFNLFYLNGGFLIKKKKIKTFIRIKIAEMLLHLNISELGMWFYFFGDKGPVSAQAHLKTDKEE